LDEQDFTPAVKIGENFAILTTTGNFRYYETIYVEPVPFSADLIEDFGELAASSVSRANKIDLLEFDGSSKTESDISEVGQIRFYPIDDISISVKQPSAMGKFKTLSTEIRVDHNTIELDPSLKSTEIYIYESGTPYFDIYNNTQYTLPKTRAAYGGWRIVGRLLKAKPDKCTYLVAAGYVS